MGKFETTGSAVAPTVLPNERRQTAMRLDNLNVGGNYGGQMAGIYAVTKSIGVVDPYNVGGRLLNSDGQEIQPTRNYHKLITASSHMLKNSEWGAATYLAYSAYGAGMGNVQMNTSNTESRNSNDEPINGITGCGPYASGDIAEYGDGGAIGVQSACSTQNRQRAWNGVIGQLASTTNNWYGVYDMAGGNYEITAAVFTSYSGSTGASSYFDVAANAPYVNLLNKETFSSKPSWSSGSTTTNYANDVCTWETCGGQALHETKTVQSVTGGNQSWMGDASMFNLSINELGFADRGGYYEYGSFSGNVDMTDHMFVIFGASYDTFRISLLAE